MNSKRLAVLMLILLCVFGTGLAARAENQYIKPNAVRLTDWMSFLPDHALLTEVNIPGSHDAGTAHLNKGWVPFYVNAYASCHDETIDEQLEHGLRVLDIRVGMDSDDTITGWADLTIWHGAFLCTTDFSLFSTHPLTLGQVMNWCADFLKKHPRETVILELSPEHEKEKTCKWINEMRKMFRYDRNAPYNGVYTRYYLSNDPLPRLKDVRGCIVLLDDTVRNELVPSDGAAVTSYEMDYDTFYWNKQELLKTCFNTSGVQNYVNGRGKTVWKRENYRNQEGKYGEPITKIVGTNLNIAGNLGPCAPSVSGLANVINQWIDKEITFQNGRRYGWVTMDYPLTGITRKIIATNAIDTYSIDMKIVWNDDRAQEARKVLDGCIGFRQKGTDIVLNGVEIKWTDRNRLVADNIPVLLPNGTKTDPELFFLPDTPEEYSIEEQTQTGEKRYQAVISVARKTSVTICWHNVPEHEVNADTFTAIYLPTGKTAPIKNVRIIRDSTEKTEVEMVIPRRLWVGEAIDLDLKNLGNLSYSPARDRNRISELCWAYDVSWGGNLLNLGGRISFEDGSDANGLRPKADDPFWSRLTASGYWTEDGQEHLAYTVNLKTDLSTSDLNYVKWSCQAPEYLAGHSVYKLKWRLNDPSLPGYASDTEGLNTTLTLMPYTDVRILWQYDDEKNRPDLLQLSLYDGTGTSPLQTRQATAADRWSVRFRPEAIADRYTVRLDGYPAGYTVKGPFVSEDGLYLYFHCVPSGDPEISGKVIWRDGGIPDAVHPDIKVKLLRNNEYYRETWTTEEDTYVFTGIDFLDENGRPYVYRIVAYPSGDAAGAYNDVSDGYDIWMLHRASVSGRITWVGEAGETVERPTWLDQSPQMLILGRIQGSGEPFEVIDDCSWMSKRKYEHLYLSLGVPGSTDPDARYEYRIVPNEADLKDLITARELDSSYDPATGSYVQNYEFRLKNPMPAIVSFPFVCNVAFDTYHPARTFTVQLTDAAGSVIAAKECTVAKNASQSPATVLSAKISESGHYYLKLAADGKDGWTDDTFIHDFNLFPVWDREQGCLVTAAPWPVSFNNSYRYTPEPLVIRMTVQADVLNDSAEKKAPHEEFAFMVNGETVPDRISEVKKYRFTDTVKAPGTYTYTFEQIPGNTPCWIYDETCCSRRVTVTLGDDGQLQAEYPDGTDVYFINTYEGKTQVIKCMKVWNDDAFISAGLTTAGLWRPKNIVIHLMAAAGDSKPIPVDTIVLPTNGQDYQEFDFGVRPRFDRHGNRIVYSLREENVPWYDTEYLGGLIINSIHSPTKYVITHGKDQVCKLYSDVSIEFDCNGPLEKFTGIRVDGLEVAPEHYTASSGSTVLHLKSTLLNTLASGSHTIQFFYTDGYSDIARFTTELEKMPPMTGDPATPYLWTSLIFLGIAGAVLTVKKRIMH